MTYDSLSANQFPFGHDSVAFPQSNVGAPLASLLPCNEHVKQSAFENYQVGYDPYLALEECSQSSLEDSCSQASDSTIPTSPLSSSSDDIVDKTHQDVADLCLSSSQDGKLRPASKTNSEQTQQAWQNGNLSSWQTVSEHHEPVASPKSPKTASAWKANWRPDTNNTSSLSCVTTPTVSAAVPTAHHAAQNVPYRPKVNTIPQASCSNAHGASGAIPLDTSRVATDVQRSRMRVQSDHEQEFLQTRRRGRSMGPPTCPPRLRRDTDHTDAIVKMIVLFCTNLIYSIWPGPMFGGEASPQHNGTNVLPLQVFITETLRRSKTSYSTLQIALYYLILLKQCLPSSPSQPGQGCRAMQCGRRMFLTALILASKYLQDRNYSARAWSKISGLPLREINDNERRYLSIVSWDLHVPKNTFENWSKIVLNICRLSMDPEACGRGSDQQSPGPGTGPTGQKCFLQSTCKDSMTALRNWWLSNLRGLCTNVVRCPKRTEGYISSISPFRDNSFLPRPIFENSSQEEINDASPGDEMPRTLECLPRLPSIDRISEYLQSNEQINSPAATSAIPPPPMLANLPTPQTTPHTDMSRMWTPQLGKSTSRCRASASALGNLDRSRCPMANLETCPPPAPRLCLQTQRSWSDCETVPLQHVPDRPSTSSPESVVSDVFSMPSRSRSSSISSTASWLTSASSSTAPPDKERVERFSQHLNSAQQQCSSQYVQQVACRRQQSVPRRPAPSTLQSLARPPTAFKVGMQSQAQCSKAHSSSRLSAPADCSMDEGYGSDDAAKYSQEAFEKATAAQALAELQASQDVKQCLSWPSVYRNEDELRGVTRGASNKTQVLKRCRAESIEQCQKTREDYKKWHNLMNHIPEEERPDFAEFCEARDDREAVKQIQRPTEPYLQSRMPVQLATQNKRFALQAPASAAADLAGCHLRRDILLGRC
ncbi:PHO85 cyclin-5 [Lithohypha guttulata]|uniref:PHO85 cyclin-5 n=1 Tax=Lithohypha guttulata TaxID=1690604 RepID=A0ABR0KA96_9EURO|nr:PHO85 cyclin-5 [Lithohypha guttulata]